MKRILLFLALASSAFAASSGDWQFSIWNGPGLKPPFYLTVPNGKLVGAASGNPAAIDPLSLPVNTATTTALAGKQPLSSGLTDLSALTDEGFVYFDGTDFTIQNVTDEIPSSEGGQGSSDAGKFAVFGDGGSLSVSQQLNLAGTNGTVSILTDLLTSLWNQRLPNKSGTFAMTSDITATNLTGSVSILNGGTGSTTAAGALTAFGGTTVGVNLFKATNPSAITFPQINADNSVTWNSASAERTALGLGSLATQSSLTTSTATNLTGLIKGNGSVLSAATAGTDYLTPTGSLTANTGLPLSTGVTGTLPAANGGFGTSVAASSGVPLFASGVPTFAGTNGTGNFVRTTSPALTTPDIGAATGTSLSTTGSLTLNSGGYGVYMGGYPGAPSSICGLWLGDNTYNLNKATIIGVSGQTLLNAENLIEFRLLNATKGRFFASGGLGIGGTPVDPGADSLNVVGSITLGSGLNLPKTITPTGTTGAQTINKPTGRVNFAAAATSLVVTDSLCTTNSIVTANLSTNDTTAVLGAVVPGSGSFTIYMKTAPTAETAVSFRLTN